MPADPLSHANARAQVRWLRLTLYLVALFPVAALMMVAPMHPPAVAAVAAAPSHASADITPSADPIGQWPLRPQPEVIEYFDPPDNPYGSGHRGVDLAGRVGQPVYAALPGVISFSGMLAGRGVVVVNHGATRTTYEPVVAGPPVGTQVGAGAAIGRLAVVGSHCFPQACLHWGWRRGDTYLDPLRLVGAQPVRLLPLAGGLPGRAALPPSARGSAPSTIQAELWRLLRLSPRFIFR